MDIDTLLIVGDVSFGVNTDFLSAEVLTTVDVASFRFQDISGLGLICSPASIHYKEYEYVTTSFFNADLYYSLFKNKFIVLGPFIGINALGINRLDFFEFTAGLLFRFDIAIDIFNNSYIPLVFEVVKAQVGYRYHNKKHDFHAQLGIDLFGLLYVVAQTMMDTEIPKNIY
jgi:hypothetical protein